MRTHRMLWFGSALIYVLFTIWYTDFGGPLQPDEIERYMAVLEENSPDPATASRFRTFMETDTGNQFLMVNIIDMADDPGPVEGAAPGATAGELMAYYMEHMYAELFARASHPVLAGNAVHDALDLAGIENAEHWELAALMRYRSRRTLMEIIMIPATAERHEYKLAALEKTIAFPIETVLYLSDPRMLLALQLFALTALIHIVTSKRGA